MFDSCHSLSLSLGFEFSHFSNRLLCFPRFVTDLHRSRIKLFCVLFVRVCVSLIDLHFWIEDLCMYFLGFWFGGLVCRIVEKWRSSTQPWALSTRRPSRRRGGSSGDSLLRSTALLSCSASRTISLSLSLSLAVTQFQRWGFVVGINGVWCDWGCTGGTQLVPLTRRQRPEVHSEPWNTQLSSATKPTMASTSPSGSWSPSRSNSPLSLTPISTRYSYFYLDFLIFN